MKEVNRLQTKYHVPAIIDLTELKSATKFALFDRIKHWDERKVVAIAVAMIRQVVILGISPDEIDFEKWSLCSRLMQECGWFEAIISLLPIPLQAF